MAENKNYTRKNFLNDMLALDLTAEQRECAEKWLVALEKKASAPTVNKKALENEALAHKMVEAMRTHADALVNAKWLTEYVAGVTTPQKGTAVANAAIKLGLVERYTEKGRTYYKLV